MEIRTLVKFLQIVKDGSFSKAAQSLYLVQPTLSKSMQELENELGVKLFQKTGQKIELTEYGKKLVEIATPVVLQFNNIQKNLFEESNQDNKEISICSTPIIAELYLSDIITKYCVNHQNVKIHINESNTYEVKNQIVNGLYDIGFCFLDEKIKKDNRIEIKKLFTKEICVIANKNNPITEKKNITMKELEHQRFNIYTEGHAIRNTINEMWREAGITPEININSGNGVFLIKMVAAGNGISILPKDYAKKNESDDIRILHFTPKLEWPGGMIIKRESYHSKTTIDFINYAISYMGKLGF